MAYQFNGNNAFMDFSIGNLTGVDGGPLSVAALVNLGDAANGAIAHIVNATAAAGVVFLETFGTLNYGVSAIARPVSSGNLSGLGVVGNWSVIGGSKDDVSAIPRGHYGVLGSPLTHFNGASALTDVSAGSAADGTFKVRLGRWLSSTSEYINGAYAVAAIFKRVLSDAEWDSLSTGNYATWQALDADWMVEFTAIGTRTDATGGGGNETARTGTPAISLVADPAGFFGGGGPGPQTSTDSFAFDDGTFKITAHDAEVFALADTALKLGLTDSDTALLSEAQHGSVVASDSFTLDDTVIRGSTSHFDTFTLDEQMHISLSSSDTFSLSTELERLGLTSTDAFTVSDAVFAGHGSVISGDTFALIEQHRIDGLPPTEGASSAPITITLSSPALTLKLGTPSIVISLTTPQMRIELE